MSPGCDVEFPSSGDSPSSALLVSVFEVLSPRTHDLLRAMPERIKKAGFADWVVDAWVLYVRSMRQPYNSSRKHRVIAPETFTLLVEASIERFAGVTAGISASFIDDLRDLLSRIPERTRRLLAARWGLDSKEAIPTLEDLGRAEGVTRERVRQIVAQAEKRLRLDWPPLAMVAITEAALRQCGSIATGAELLRTLPVQTRPPSAMAFRTLDAIAPLRGETRLAQQNGYWLIGDVSAGNVSPPQVVKDIRRAVAKELRFWGSVRKATCLEAGGEDGVDLAIIELDRRGGHMVVEEWLVPLAGKRSALATHVHRLSGTVSQLQLLRLHRQLLRRLRAMPPLQVLRAVLERQLGLKIDADDNVLLSTDREATELPLGGGEALAARLLREAGGALTLVDLQRLFIENGFSAAMAGVLAGRSSVIERLGPNVLGLVGARIAPDRLRTLRRSAISQSAIEPLGFRNGPGGQVHLMYRVESDLLGTAMFRLPANRVPAGRYEVEEARHLAFVVKKNYLIGPHRYLRPLLAKQKTVTLSFDPIARTATVSIR